MYSVRFQRSLGTLEEVMNNEANKIGKEAS